MNAVGERPRGLAFGVAGRRRDAEAHRRDVVLARVEQHLRELGRLAEAERQQSRRQRIERPRVAGLLGGVEPLRALQRRVRRKAGGLVEQQHAVDPPARGPGGGGAPEPSGIRLLVGRDGFVDQLRQAHAGLDRVVVGEVQLRHRVELHPVRELGAQEAGGALQRPHRLVGVLAAGEVRDEDLRVREVGRDFDRR